MLPHRLCIIFLPIVCISHALAFPHFSYIGSSDQPSRDQYTGKPRVPPSTSHRFWTLSNVTRLQDSTEEVNIAYFIQISDSSLSLTRRLLDRIHHPQNFYALHFDIKISPYKVVKVITEIKTNPAYRNVHIMERESVTYRGITMVLNNLAAISELFELGDWDYFINLSGSDYPLVSPIVQRKLLALPFVRDRASNFFTFSAKEQWTSAMHYRFDQISVDTALGMSNAPEDSNLVVLDKSTPLLGKLKYEFVKGEGWFILTRDACKFMVESSYARKMLLSMAFSQDASEHFYVSLFWNHPDFNRTIIPHALRTVYWNLNGVPSGQHPYVIDQMVEEDGSYSLWRWLQKSPHFFARKFDQPDNPVMDLIDNQVSGVGNEINRTAIAESMLCAEQHLHWLYDIKPEEDFFEDVNDSEEVWPTRR